VVPKIGNHVLQYWSTDLVGNVEVTTTVPFFVRDPLPPLVVCDVAGPYTSYATINIKATDPVNGSGVASISRQVDSEPTVTVAANTATFDCDVAGSHTITYWAIDKAGNSSTPVSAAFVVDPGTLVYISNKSRTVSAGAWVTIKGHIDAASAAVKPLGQFVVAQRLTATGWVSAGVADSPLWINGSYEFARIKVTRNTTFRVSTRPGSLLVLGHSKPLVLGAKAVLSTPKLSKPVPTAKKTFRVSGTVYPAHASTVVVSWYKVNSRGRRTLYSTPTTLALSSAGTWSQSKKLAHGRWAVKVTHADADHVSASSAYRTFSVH
jgi:hypothetical protein